MFCRWREQDVQDSSGCSLEVAGAVGDDGASRQVKELQAIYHRLAYGGG